MPTELFKNEAADDDAIYRDLTSIIFPRQKALGRATTKSAPLERVILIASLGKKKVDR